MDSFKTYMTMFEKALADGVSRGELGVVRKVPVAHGRLAKRRIGRVLGLEVVSDVPFVIDYYGFMKKSRGFMSMVKGVGRETGKQVKSIDATVIHFNGLRLELLGRLKPELIQKFGEFKKAVLDAREFNHNYQA